METAKTVSRTFNEYEDFNAGDIVKLKSGSPNLTVVNASSSQILCAWFDGVTFHSQEFDQGALEKVVVS